MEVHFSTLAEIDLDAIAAASLSLFGAQQQITYLRSLRSECLALPDYLSIARPVEGRDELKSWVHQSHVIFFRQVDGDLEIVRILHARQLPARHL